MVELIFLENLIPYTFGSIVFDGHKIQLSLPFWMLCEDIFPCGGSSNATSNSVAQRDKFRNYVCRNKSVGTCYKSVWHCVVADTAFGQGTS